MSATNHTGNYNLPIYEAGNTANWLVDFNGAMSTIDSAMNENKLAGDTLKTDMEELQTDFQQVSTKADAAEQAATQASTNAANALTIANNATTIAGDAQVDAHAALTQIEKLTKNQENVGGIYGFALDTFFSEISYGGRFGFFLNASQIESYDGHTDLYVIKTVPKITNPTMISRFESLPNKTVIGLSEFLNLIINGSTINYEQYYGGMETFCIYKDSNGTYSWAIIMSSSVYNILNNENRYLNGGGFFFYLYNPALKPLELSLKGRNEDSLIEAVKNHHMVTIID